MNSRERIQTILRKQIPDRMGLFESFWPETLRSWAPQGYPVNDKGEPMPPEDVFDFDLVWCGPDVAWEPKRGFSEVVEESDESKLIRNGAGALLRWWKNRSGTPEHVGFEMTSREAWDRMKQPLLELDTERIGSLEDYRKRRDKIRADGKFAFTGTMYVFEFMRASLGDVCMLESMLLDPEWIVDFCRTYSRFLRMHYNYAFDKAGLPDGGFVYEDLGYSNGLWASPEVMRRLVVPYHKELVGLFHGRGLPVIFHTCGDIREGFDFIVESGWDCLQPMEAKAGNHVLEFADRRPGEMSYMGNINVVVLETGDRDLIRKEIESKLIPIRERGIPYVFHSDHSIPPTITYDVYRYALDIYRSLAEYR